MPPRRVTFQPGEIIISDEVKAALNQTGEEISPYLIRYLHGDWGLITDTDLRINNEALLEDRGGGELIGIYQLRDRTTIEIYTDADRQSTIISLLESE